MWRRARIPACLAILAALGAGCGSRDPAGLTVTDLEGRTIRPFDRSDAARTAEVKAEVLLFVAPDCPISNALAPEVRRICEEYGPRGVDFHLVYAEGDVATGAIEEHIQEYGYTVPALLDFEHELVEYTGATVTPEAAVLTPAGQLIYLGRINDLFTDFGKRRAQPTTAELRDALDAVLAGKKPPTARVQAIGCFIPEP